ncbi:Allantoicase, partial [Massospora cicadina]
MARSIFSKIVSPFLRIFRSTEENCPQESQLVAEQPPTQYPQDQSNLATDQQALGAASEDSSFSSMDCSFISISTSNVTTPNCIRVTSDNDINEIIEETINFVSKNMETEIKDVSNDFFGCAENLINPTTPVANPGTFIENGAWHDGWESRRHNLNLMITSDSFCYGELEGAYVENDEVEPNWELVLPKAPIIPNSNNFFKLRNPTKIYNLLKLKGYPDGGMNRLRVCGTVRRLEPSE